MLDPVMANDGCTYEREAITAWFQQHGAVSPTTGEAVDTTDLIPNHALRSLLEQLRQAS